MAKKKTPPNGGRWAKLTYPGKTVRIVVYVTPQTAKAMTAAETRCAMPTSEIAEHCFRTTDRLADVTAETFERVRASR